MRKGMVFETLGFVILAIAILGIIIFLRTYLVGGYGKSFTTVTERHELEGFKAGANSVLKTTEPKSGKTIGELIGIAAYIGDTSIDFGPGVGVIDVKKELEWRLDALYGEDHWYLKVPFPATLADIQIVAVSDVSGSMCDDVKDVAERIPGILDDLRAGGKNAEMTLFLLGVNSCCVKDNGNFIRWDLDIPSFPETAYFHVRSIDDPRDCELGGSNTDEDWGTGLKCAIEAGPYKGPSDYGWREHAIKIAIPMSDELPGSSYGSYSGPCPNAESRSQRTLFERGLNAALDNGVKVFPLKAVGCGIIYQPRGTSCNPPDSTDLTNLFYCSCNEKIPGIPSSGVVEDWMREIAEKTEGEYNDLKEALKAAEAIKKIITEIPVSRTPYLEAGTTIPIQKNVRAVTNPIPITQVGIFTKIYLYQWS